MIEPSMINGLAFCSIV